MWLCEETGLPYQVVGMPFPAPQSYQAMRPLATVPSSKTMRTAWR